MAGKRAATVAGLRCCADTLLRRVINTLEANRQVRLMSVSIIWRGVGSTGTVC